MSSTPYYNKSNTIYKNDEELERNVYAAAISTVASATAAASFSERIKALENAGMKESTFVKKRIPENKVAALYENVNPNNNRILQSSLKITPSNDDYLKEYQQIVEDEDDEDSENSIDDGNYINEYQQGSFNNKTSSFECPPFKPPSRTPSNDSLPHSPNFDNPKVKAYSYNFTSKYDNDDDSDDQDSTQNISIKSPADCVTAVRLVTAAVLSAKPPPPKQATPPVSPKFNKDSMDDYYQNVINSIAPPSPSPSSFRNKNNYENISSNIKTDPVSIELQVDKY
jgi:hypothetical protein